MNEESKLTKQECLAILDRFAGWNHGQCSMEKARMGGRGQHTVEDDIYDARRELILKATKRLSELT